MGTSTCSVCNRYITGHVKFADYQPLSPGRDGHTNGFAYFCQAHLQAAQRLSHLPSYQAIPIIKQSQHQQPFSGAMPQETVVFEHKKGHLIWLAIVMLFFTILPLFIILMYFSELPGYLMPYGKIIFGRVALLLLIFSGAALTGRFSYWAIKQYLNKKPRLTLDSEGFIDLFVSDNRIFWRDITEMKFRFATHRYSGARYKIALSLNETSEFKRNTFILKRMLNKINPLGSDVVVDITMLDSPALHVHAQFKDFYKRFGPRR